MALLGTRSRNSPFAATCQHLLTAPCGLYSLDTFRH